MKNLQEALFDAEALDVVANDGEEDVSVEAFLMFEKKFIDGARYNFKAIESYSSAMSFEVWGIKFARESHGEEPYEFRHIVNFNKEEGVVECSCKMFTEVGILCYHCLRVLHACCVEHVPNRYIIKRWCKGIKGGHNLELGSSTDANVEEMNSIITANQINKNARAHCEKCFLELKELVEFDVGSIHCDEDGNVKVLNSLPNVLNPPGSRQKGVRNKKFKSIVYQLFEITLPTFNHLSLVLHDQHRVGSFPLLSFHPTYYFHSANSSLVFMPVMAPPVLQQLHSDAQAQVHAHPLALARAHPLALAHAHPPPEAQAQIDCCKIFFVFQLHS
ncbi:hypothetical protein Cgig2_018759 [Carnegiea gigantea]|uniref:SWIM-type domain-containing protein n=1 Tax=Carnegiea gigantea TaxID=171969 RepID=A0A9Q1JH55_9CARY|nr:hypothetical protein Cgig2_018759 [Carnegiea gigantea]